MINVSFYCIVLMFPFCVRLQPNKATETYVYVADSARWVFNVFCVRASGSGFDCAVNRVLACQRSPPSLVLESLASQRSLRLEGCATTSSILILENVI